MPKIQESAENYLETILVLKERNGTVRSVDIAAEMGFSKPSVSVAMKNLREQECITMGEDGLISLTEKGRKIAESVYERHTLFTQWLVSLGVDAATAAKSIWWFVNNLAFPTATWWPATWATIPRPAIVSLSSTGSGS